MAASAPDAPADVYAQLTPEDGDDSPLGLYLAAETALDQGESGPAAALFARASVAAPDVPDLRDRAFTTNLLAGRIKEAVRFTPMPQESAPSGVALGRLVRGVDALADDRGKEAVALLSDNAVGAPYTGVAALLAPWAAIEAGDRAAVPPAKVQADDAATSFADLGRARLLERMGRNADAEVVFRRQAATGQTLLVGAYGGFLERRGRRPEAIKLYDAALKGGGEATLAAARARAARNDAAPAQPTPREAAAEALIGPAAAAIGSHQLDSGLIYVRLALRLDPSLGQAWIVVGDALTAAGDTEGARLAFEQVKDGAPEAVSAWGRLAVQKQGAGDKAGALALAAKAVARAPDDTSALLLQAELLRENDRNDEAIAILDKLIAVSGDGRPGQRLYFMRGAAEERAGRWPAAEADLKKAVALKPDDPEVLNYLGFAWADRGEHLDQALPMLQKAAAAASDQGAILDSVGWAHFRLGDYKAAVRDLEKAVSLEPADATINDHLGDAYWSSGRRLEAGYQWRRVLTLEPEPKLKAAVEIKLRDGPPAAKAVVAAAAS